MELGPTTYYNWMLSTYTITQATTLPLSGGLSDIYGRRNFFLAGCCIALVGTIIAAAAQNTPMMIAAEGIKGIGSGCQQLALAAVGELVPRKHRGYAQAGMDLLSLPWLVFGALTGNAMVKYHSLSFRINYIIGTVLNVLSLAASYFWYFPPAGKSIPGKSRLRQTLSLDWTGLFLMASGIVLFLVGIGLGGVNFPWSSAGAIAPIVIGFLLILSFGFWEWKVAANPFMTHDLFTAKTARTFCLFLPITFVGGMGIYSAAAFWTQQMMAMFETDPIKLGILSIPGGFVGGFLGGVLMGKHRIIFSSPLMLLYGLIFKLVGDGIMTTILPSTLSRAIGASFLSMVGVGWLTVSSIVVVQLCCADTHIGLTTLLTGSTRSIGGSVAVVIYTTVLHNTLDKEAGRKVAERVLPLGLRVEALPALVEDLVKSKGKTALQIPGVTPRVLQAASEGLKFAYAEGFKYIYVTSMAFGAIAIVLACFTRDVTPNMTNSVAVRLQNEKKRPVKVEEEVVA
ncbi:hypothetical protein K402DRAFT_327999 [Aulographum hederae CBS 113979]|uniref:Major facilitator superfamily (MFS) profile domain-containing protein n=1 Tax=Aulographum hederae CBS 113979 TaxID=1176131 RepID=A0A6G1H705_9PEZI|nr:hypothetical protein K402DRAFT_327999 [Aulographum hederae CBS 113979]